MAALLPLTLTPATTMPRDKPSTTTLVRRKAVRRLAPQLSVSLPILPYTTAEWAKAVADVKREYLNRRYRPCAARCCEILDNIRDLSIAEPAYLIYLHFYAASAQEMQARSLSHANPCRTSLLKQARDHYTEASNLIKTADATAVKAPRRCPGLHSPTSSVSSQASTTSSASTVVSPVSPISSLRSPGKVYKKKKHVTFLDLPIETATVEPIPTEPIIRPDSPTLGFDDWSGRSSPELINALPLPPTMSPTKLTQLTLSLSPSKLESLPELDPEPEAELETDPFHHARTIHRYCTILTSLQRQITLHLSFIDSDLAHPPPVKSREQHDDELRKKDLKARIERLRASGWQRRRFDAQRYEALRENALADLS